MTHAFHSPVARASHFQTQNSRQCSQQQKQRHVNKTFRKIARRIKCQSYTNFPFQQIYHRFQNKQFYKFLKFVIFRKKRAIPRLLPLTSSQKPGFSATISTVTCTVPPAGTLPTAGYTVNIPSWRRMFDAPVVNSTLGKKQKSNSTFFY